MLYARSRPVNMIKGLVYGEFAGDIFLLFDHCVFIHRFKRALLVAKEIELMIVPAQRSLGIICLCREYTHVVITV